MKKLFLFLLSTLLFVSCGISTKVNNAESSRESFETIKFMGIPVDGSMQKIEFALRQKGFRRIRSGVFSGSFNGRDSDVYIHTNHKKVDRIMVVDQQPGSALKAKEYFNILLNQLEDKVEYFKLLGDSIPSDTDVEYEMTVNNKTFEASYFYAPEEFFVSTIKTATDELLDEITEERFNEIKEGRFTDADMEALVKERVIKRLLNNTTGQLSICIVRYQSGKYSVAIYYDNLHNRPHGEDL